jgi:hypothetical protein
MVPIHGHGAPALCGACWQNASQSDLDSAELALVKQRVEQHLSPEIAKEREVTLQAIGQAEQGWQAETAERATPHKRRLG